MSIFFNFNNMFSEAIGESEGLSKRDLMLLSRQIKAAQDCVGQNLGVGWQGWTELPHTSKEEINEIIQYGKKISKFENVVVLGIGGSALGTIAVANALLHFRHNELKRSERRAPKLYVEDNVDPERMQALLDVINIHKTFFFVVTKSGETSETLSQFLIIYAALREKLGEEVKNRVCAITTQGKGTLFEIAKQEEFKTYSIPEGVGGRFSVLSNVGLVPLAALGVDIKKLLKGAADMSKACLKKRIEDNPALYSAVLQYISMKKGKNISVLMPYADTLKYMADFYCQLWGESLGKAVDKNGATVHAGQTPVRALGVTDQHSQIQLYTEGPFDKVVTFLGVESFDTDVEIPHFAGAPNTKFLQGHTLAELINAEFKATEFALRKANRANFSIILKQVNEHSVGALLQYFMYQTAYAGALLNVDTFNQPGVEEGKKATFAMLGRQGYDEKLKEINSATAFTEYTILV